MVFNTSAVSPTEFDFSVIGAAIFFVLLPRCVAWQVLDIPSGAIHEEQLLRREKPDHRQLPRQEP